MYNANYNYDCDEQEHVHEFTGSTATIIEGRECHNHRFCTVSGEAIKMGNSHIHEIKFHTDFADGHFHEFCGKTFPAIEVGNGKHVHFLKDITPNHFPVKIVLKYTVSLSICQSLGINYVIPRP